MTNVVRGVNSGAIASQTDEIPKVHGSTGENVSMKYSHRKE